MSICFSAQSDPSLTYVLRKPSPLWSISPLFIHQQFGISEGVIGMIFSVGSAVASVFTLVVLSNKGREFQNKYVRSPYNIYFLLCLATFTVYGLMIPNFPCQVVMVILAHIALEVGSIVRLQQIPS